MGTARVFLLLIEMQQGGKEEGFIHNTKSRHDDSSVVDPVHP